MQLLFATQNQNKTKEIKALMPENVELLNLTHFNFLDELPENQSTLEGNALEKAKYVYQQFGVNCFADDTGLEIEALQGAPGVLSARYAGEEKNPEQNMNKVLAELINHANRNACFRTVIALIIDDKEYLFEGKVDGVILPHKTGKKGFGYDPIFLPKGFNHSFAEMTLEEKNKISHRARALEELIGFIKTV